MAETSKASRGRRPRAVKGLTTAALAAGTDGHRAVRATSSSVSALIAAQMPGWKLAPDSAAPAEPVEDSSMKSERGPSISQLRRKFLGDDATDNLADSADVFSDVDESCQTVRVEPRRGGPAKTADIKNGKISIVQG